MSRTTVFVCAVTLFCLVQLASAARTFSNPEPIGYPEIGPAFPYPSTINITETFELVNVTVTLHDIVDDYFSDLWILVVSPNGTAVLLLGDGPNIAQEVEHATVTWSDDAAPPVLNETGSGNYTFRPYGNTSDPLESPGMLDSSFRIIDALFST
jgi:hypothetical protein